MWVLGIEALSAGKSSQCPHPLGHLCSSLVFKNKMQTLFQRLLSHREELWQKFISTMRFPWVGTQVESEGAIAGNVLE